jgi:hypothetical protein
MYLLSVWGLYIQLKGRTEENASPIAESIPLPVSLQDVLEIFSLPSISKLSQSSQDLPAISAALPF